MSMPLLVGILRWSGACALRGEGLDACSRGCPLSHSCCDAAADVIATCALMLLLPGSEGHVLQVYYCKRGCGFRFADTFLFRRWIV